jgi:hypothetical protein
MDINELIKQDHQQAERLRLDMGMDGCGCADCQELYRTIDLEKYGARVQRFQDIITIIPGTSGLTKKKACETAPDGQEDMEKAKYEVPANQKPQARDAISSGLMKLPYHTADQSTIFDYEIDAAIAEGGGYRTITKRLEAKGYRISFMTIKRRIDKQKAAAHA